MTRLALLPATGIIVLLGCGLFSTDTPERPVGRKDPDPLDFMMILRGAEVRFDFEDYDGLFSDTFVYTDPDNITYPRTRLLNRLQAIEAKYSGSRSGDTIKVVWYRADSTASDRFDKDKENILSARRYHVITGNPLPVDTAFSGEASFKVKYSTIRDKWLISYWRDVPLDGSPKAFFHPDFVD